jgi:hypothetical protein
MKLKLILGGIVVGLIFFQFLNPAAVFAAEGGGTPTTDCGGKAGAPPCPSGSQSIDIPNPLNLGGCGAGKSDIECLVNRITKIAWIIATPLVTIMILWAAFQLMTAGGNPEKVSNAKRTILYAVVGFVVLMFASSVVLVLEDIFSTSPPQQGPCPNGAVINPDGTCPQ